MSNGVGERVLYLVRHGQLDLRAFAKNQFAAGLTAVGREQARFTAKRLRSLDVSAIHCSTLGRARETAEIISNEFPKIVVRPSNLLWELPNLGPVDDDVWQNVFAKGKQRGERAFIKYVRPTRQRQRIEILISHGNLVRYFACRVLGIEPESWSSLGTSHCGITQLRITRQNNARIMSYNETGHLPARLRS
jgi:serine/threonine-protein phosphatase PGAM5